MVSVVIPAFNRHDFLKEAVRSVLSQTFKDFELIVVDDGSTADLSSIFKLVEDSGGRVLRNSHRGVAAARNAGVAVANRPYIAFLDSDDCWKENKLAEQLSFHRDHGNLRISQTEELWFRNGVRVNPRFVHKKPEGNAFSRSTELCCISPSSVMLERGLFIEHGGFDEQMTVCEDYELWLRISAKEPIGLLKNSLVVKHGGHEDQLSRSMPAIDRFRVYALAKLLATAELNSEQQSQALRQLEKKSRILAAGARKRGRTAMSIVYSDIAESAEKCRQALDEDMTKRVFTRVLPAILGLLEVT